MKWTKEIKSKFTVFVISSDVEKGAGIKTAIAQEGFETFLFTDAEVLYGRMKEAAPHVLVLTHGSLSVPLQEFVQAVVEMNSEIRFLPIFPTSEIGTLLKYRPYNFASMVLDGDGLYSRVAWSVDEICQACYLTYQNEQIYALYEKAKLEEKKTQAEIKEIELRAENSEIFPIQQELSKYLHSKSKEDVLSVFLRELNQKYLARNKKITAIYFKYLPSVSSLVALQSLGIEIESLKGVGCRLTEQEFSDPVLFLAQGGMPSELKVLMKEVLGVSEVILKSIFIQEQLDGVFAFWSTQGDIASDQLDNDLTFFSLVYERSHLMKKITALDLSDDVTELYGRQHYLKHLSEEVARARRLQKAVSIIKMSVDHLSTLSQSMGKGGRDQILRSIASMVQKTSRVNDISCRTAENEFSLILPHAARKGALIRAERLRRMVENYSSKWTGTGFTVSCGIGEYPSHCSSADDLEKVSIEALEFINAKGGNKVCLYQPAESFQPDYEVPPL